MLRGRGGFDDNPPRPACPWPRPLRHRNIP